MTILITNENVAAAMHELLAEMTIPKPWGWTPKMIQIWLKHTAIPAYLSSLAKIAAVEPALGFSIELAAKEFHEGQIRRIQEAQRANELRRGS